MAVSEDGRTGGQGWVVLVADDEPAVCGLCREVAESLGLSVLDAPSTEDALEKLDRQRVDLVLADLRMPSAGGMALSPSSAFTICCTCCLPACPLPTVARLICSALYSVTSSA